MYHPPFVISRSGPERAERVEGCAKKSRTPAMRFLAEFTLSAANVLEMTLSICHFEERPLRREISKAGNEISR